MASARRRRDAVVWLVSMGAFAVVMAAIALRYFHFGAVLERASFAYPSSPPAACVADSPADEQASETPRLVVRAPKNYVPTFAHPLLVVFSPAGFTAELSERHLGLTRAATMAGVLVVYVDSLPLSRAAITAFARVPARVARRWCIDPARITLAGHSDGGTVAQLVALVHPDNGFQPAAIVASAGGVQASDVAEFNCPQALAVRLWHGAEDTHFPGYGASAASGWARCLGCGLPEPRAAGCVRYGGCRGELQYCEHDGGHLRWPPQATADLVALAATVRRN